MEKNEENNKTSKIKDFSSEKKKKRRLSENKSNSEVNDKNTNKIESDKDNKDNVQTNIKKEIKENPKNDEYFSNIKFSEMNLNKILLERLNLQGYEIATEIQAKSIPIALKGEDIIGSAKTGSGKSLAFLIPTVEYILNHPKNEGIQALVITPTRELALQLYDLAKILMNDNGTSCVLVIGGGNRKKEAEKLSSNEARIIICTPGRLIDHMVNTKKFDYNNIKI